MKSKTIFLGKLFGLYTLIITLWMLVNRFAVFSMIQMVLGNRPLIAFVALAIGLAMVVGHTVWSGGLLPVLVTLTGWIILIRSFLFLWLSSKTLLDILVMIHFERLFYGYLALPLIFGAVLTYLSFTAHVQTD